MATQHEPDEVIEAERRIQKLRVMLKELHTAIQDAKEILEEAERRRVSGR